MIVVIQCAGSKQPHAGHLTTKDGRPVDFVAHPELAPSVRDRILARPDDPSDRAGSWREVLSAYNADPGNNPLGVLPAFELYENGIYRRLVDRYGVDNCYILSAGWGLIRADFLTPNYDITFSPSAPRYLRRHKADHFADFAMMPGKTSDPVVFFGSKEYAPLFARLTHAIASRKIVFFNSSVPPSAPGCDLLRYETTTRTNWQYECVAAFLAGAIQVPTR